MFLVGCLLVLLLLLQYNYNCYLAAAATTAILLLLVVLLLRLRLPLLVLVLLLLLLLLLLLQQQLLRPCLRVVTAATAAELVCACVLSCFFRVFKICMGFHGNSRGFFFMAGSQTLPLMAYLRRLKETGIY